MIHSIRIPKRSGRGLQSRGPISRILCLLVCFWPMLAMAHEETGAATGFLRGFHHPISGLDHVIAMVAVGIWGAQLGRPAIWVLPVTFPTVMAFGGMLGLLGVRLPGAEVCVALSAVALGLVILLEARPPLAAAGMLVGFFAIFHGYAHGTELPPGTSGITYSIGFVVATGLLHACGIAIGLVHRWPAGRRALRVVGAIIMAGGCFYLWRALR